MRCRCAALCCAALQVALAITKHGEGTVAVSGTVFADAMYDGDLMAAAGVKTQIGRESRE